MNSFTGTPVNTVWFVAATAIPLGLLALAGAQAIDAIFALSVSGLYVAYAIPIAARFIFKNNFKPGPFNLGIFVSPSPNTQQNKADPIPYRVSPLPSFPCPSWRLWTLSSFSLRRHRRARRT